MQANLSRIHHLIKSTTEEFNSVSNRINSMKIQFSFKIFEKTKEEDFQYFCKELEKRKKEFYSLQNRMIKLLEYIDYLKDSLAHANDKFGINAKLTKAASLGRKIRHMQSFIEYIAGQHSLQMEPIKNMDFYKTTFTDQVKVYDLPIFLFTEADFNDFRNKRKKLIAEQQALNDEIATLNQNNSLEIATFEEFLEDTPKEITI